MEAVVQVRTLALLIRRLCLKYNLFATVSGVLTLRAVLSVAIESLLALPGLIRGDRLALFKGMLQSSNLLAHQACLGLRLLQLGLAHLQLPVDPGNLTLLLVENALELLFKFLLSVFEFVFGIGDHVFLFLFKFFDSLVENFDVQFELLFDLDVVSDLGFVLLKLLLVLLWGKVDGLKR